VKHFLGSFAVLVCLSTLSLAANPPKCNAMTVRGTYAFHEEGHWIAGNAAGRGMADGGNMDHLLEPQFYTIGTVTFGPNGTGSYTLQRFDFDIYTLSTQDPTPIQYAVAPDCSMYWGDGDTRGGVIAEGGKRIFWLSSAGGEYGLRGEAVKQ
jgi:hypothetical protein